MIINRNNYEEFALDYLDGELSADMAKRMKVFLKQNPDIDQELEEMRGFVLTPDKSLIFRNKESLKMPLTSTKVVPIYRRMKPWMAVAAVFLGVLFFVKYITSSTNINTVPPITYENESFRGNEVISAEPTKKETAMTAPESPSSSQKTTNQSVTSKNTTAKTRKINKPSPTPSLPKARVENTIAHQANSSQNTIIQTVNPPKKSFEVNPQNTNKQVIDPKPEIDNSPIAKQKPKKPEPERIKTPSLAPAPIQQKSDNEPVENIALQPEKESTIASAAPKTRKKSRLRFFPKMQEKLSGESLKKALLPESLVSKEPVTGVNNK